MADDRQRCNARLAELAKIQKQRHLTESELWECADLLYALGYEGKAREAEAAAIRQRARETIGTPDATFSVAEDDDLSL